jgi:hypothetical protein
MWLPLTAAMLGANLVVPVADTVPTINVTPSCRAISSGISAIGRDFDSCMRSEQTAKEQLEKQWPEFTPAERTRCFRASTVGGEATYTETLTCLEMERDVRKLPAGSASESSPASIESGRSSRPARR